MTFKPPIPTDELHDIGVRKDPADINRLLWEIKRLRSIALRANQVLRETPENTGSATGIVAKYLLDELKVEPCVMDEDRRRIDSQG
jgi:hypothetical protein